MLAWRFGKFVQKCVWSNKRAQEEDADAPEEEEARNQALPLRILLS